jgi:hypothetical protein
VVNAETREPVALIKAQGRTGGNLRRLGLFTSPKVVTKFIDKLIKGCIQITPCKAQLPRLKQLCFDFNFQALINTFGRIA